MEEKKVTPRAKKHPPRAKSLKEEKKAKLPVTPPTPYFANFKGPILFTAPHSMRVFRGGKEWNEEVRIH